MAGGRWIEREKAEHSEMDHRLFRIIKGYTILHFNHAVIKHMQFCNASIIHITKHN